MIRKIKIFFVSICLLSLLSLFVTLRYHFVLYKSGVHFISKDALTFQHTYLHVDGSWEKWKLVLKTPSLRSYFTRYYTGELAVAAKRMSAEAWKSIRFQSKKALRFLHRKGKDLHLKSKKWIQKNRAPQWSKFLPFLIPIHLNNVHYCFFSDQWLSRFDNVSLHTEW